MIYPPRRVVEGRLSSLFALCLALVPAAARAADGVWSEWEPPSATYAFQSAVFDPIRSEFVVLPAPGVSAGSEYWTLSLAGFPVWTRHETGSPSPGARTSAFVVLDSARDRLILVGGARSIATPLPGETSEVWALSLASGTWSQLAFTATRSITGAAGVYDPIGDRIIAINNWWKAETGAEVWTLPLSTTAGWSQIIPTGNVSPLYQHAAIYDPIRHRMLVYGGPSISDPVAIDLDDPPQIHYLGSSGAGPGPLGWPSMAYDAIGDRMLVYGGNTTNSKVWALALSGAPVWSALTNGATSDPARDRSGVAFDPVYNEMLMFGGADLNGLTNDCWRLDLSAYPSWVPLSGVVAVEPAGRDLHSALADPVRDRMLIYGGIAQSNLGSFELWSHGWSAASPWISIATVGPAASPTEPIAYDSQRDRLLGYSSNALVALPLAGTGTRHWANLSPSGTAPSTRKGVAAAYDPASDRYFVFGGRLVTGGGTSNTWLNDLWTVNLTGTPAWTKINTSGAKPPARWLARFVLDAKRGRLLLMGGSNATDGFRDLWQLSLGATPQWTELGLDGVDLPSPSAAVIDTLEDRILALWGSQLYSMPLAGTPEWTLLAPSGVSPWPRTGASLALDPVRREAVLFGGLRAADNYRTRELWSVSFPPPSVAVTPGPSAGLSLIAWPNPARDRLDVSFTLARAGRVRLELVDVAGRRVREVDAGWLAAGSHALRLGADGARLPAGLYFVTLRAAEGSRSAKVVIAE